MKINTYTMKYAEDFIPVCSRDRITLDKRRFISCLEKECKHLSMYREQQMCYNELNDLMSEVGSSSRRFFTIENYRDAKRHYKNKGDRK